MENPRLHVLLRTLQKSGRRFGELYGVRKAGQWKFGVTLADIDFDNRWFYTFILKKSRKTKKGGAGKAYRKKLAFLDEDTLTLIREYADTAGIGPDDYVFRYKHYRSIQRDFKNLVERLGIQKNITLHSFRAYFITFCRRKGMSYEDIIKMTGHARRETIAIYDHTEALEIEKKAREVVDEI